VVVVAAAIHQYAAVALGGILPAAITGLSGLIGGTLVSADPTTSKLRVFVGGDESLGYASPNGNIVLDFGGRLL
jgi:hypothetical protein